MAGKDTFTLLARWAALVGDLPLAVAPLRVVFAQTLIRKLCPDCREGYRPDPEMLRKINLPADRIDKLYRPPTQPLVDEHGKEFTCPTCQGTGYLGRTAVFEVLAVDDELRRLVINNASAAEIKQHCRARKMLYLQEEALRKVIGGETSINEVLRVFRESK
jgi:type II secretory ATPase GspE/PulE/Tfp pilus assembly ATPase PilB-like protein